MENIEPRRRADGTVSYRARVRLKGHPVVSATFDRKTDARTWITATKAAIREKRYFPQKASEQYTVDQLCDRFIDEKLPLRAARDRRQLEAQLDWWRSNLGGETPLASITPARIVEVRDLLTKGKSPSGKPVSPATVKRYLAVLSKAFSVAAREWFWIDDNPCTRVPRPREPRGRARYLSPDDEKPRLIQACAEVSDELHLLVWTALSTGGRVGELLRLRWPMVHLDRGMVLFLDTKNGDSRAAPLVGPARDLMTIHKRRKDTSLVFWFSEQSPAGREATPFPRNLWEKAVSAAGIEDFTFHDLRHTAASYLAMSGASLREIADFLGHKTLAMVQRYSHLSVPHTLSIANRMSDKFLAA